MLRDREASMNWLSLNFLNALIPEKYRQFVNLKGIGGKVEEYNPGVQDLVKPNWKYKSLKENE